MNRLTFGLTASLLLVYATGNAEGLTAYRLTTDGLGSLKIGMRTAQILSVGYRLKSPAYASHPEVCTQVDLKNHEGVSLIFENDRLTSVTVRTPNIHTLSGAGVGNTKSEIKNIYGAKLETVGGPDNEESGHYMRLSLANERQMIFWLTEQYVVSAISSGGSSASYADGCH